MLEFIKFCSLFGIIFMVLYGVYWLVQKNKKVELNMDELLDMCNERGIVPTAQAAYAISAYNEIANKNKEIKDKMKKVVWAFNEHLRKSGETVFSRDITDIYNMDADVTEEIILNTFEKNGYETKLIKNELKDGGFEVLLEIQWENGAKELLNKIKKEM